MPEIVEWPQRMCHNPLFQSQRYTIACQSYTTACVMALPKHVPWHCYRLPKPGVHILQHRLRSCVCVCVCVCVRACVRSCAVRARAQRTLQPTRLLTTYVYQQKKNLEQKQRDVLARLEYYNYNADMYIYIFTPFFSSSPALRFHGI